MKTRNTFTIMAAGCLVWLPLSSCKEKPAPEVGQTPAEEPVEAQMPDAPNPFDFMLSEDSPSEWGQNGGSANAIGAKDPVVVDVHDGIEIEDCPPEILEKLLETDQTPEFRKRAGDAALNNAAMQGNAQLVRDFLARGIGNSSQAVAWSAENGDAAITDLLIEAGASPDAALCAAAMHGQSDLVLHLLDSKRADANAVDETLETTVLSLALQADPANKTAPFWEDKINTVKILLQHGANPDKGKSLVGICLSWPWVAPEARLEALNLLLAAGADALCKDKEGRTPREILTAQRDSEPENAATYDKAIEILRAAEEKAGE